MLLEFGGLKHPVGRASAGYLRELRVVISTLAEAAGLRDPEGVALSWHILMKGAIVQAVEGDLDSAKRAQSLARLVIEQHNS